MKKQRAFTLIEMSVVLAILGLLISIVLVSICGAGAKARDARRIADLDSIRKALLLYNHDKEDWIEFGDDCNAGFSGSGNGFFNFEGEYSLPPFPTFYYPKSMSSCLADGGYMKAEIIDPSGDRVCSSATGNCYMKYNSYSLGVVSEVYLYAKLETGPKGDENKDTTNNTPCNTCDTIYGMNYYLRVK